MKNSVRKSVESGEIPCEILCIDNSEIFQTSQRDYHGTICAPSSFCCTQNDKNSFRIRGGYVLRVNQRFLFHPEMTSYGSNRIKGM